MIRLLELLIHGCFHRWIETDRHEFCIKPDLEIIAGHVIYCKCTKCGRPKKFTLKP